MRATYDLSLSIFHAAQAQALKQELASAGELVIDAIQIWIPWHGPFDPSWLPYLTGTLAYFHGDLHSVLKSLALAEPNRAVLSRLASGLIEFGRPDYARDYSGGGSEARSLLSVPAQSPFLVPSTTIAHWDCTQRRPIRRPSLFQNRRILK